MYNAPSADEWQIWTIPKELAYDACSRFNPDGDDADGFICDLNNDLTHQIKKEITLFKSLTIYLN